MRLKLCFFVVVSTFISICAAEEATNKVVASIFYETYCPDSIKFITQQLYPTYEKLNGNIFSPIMVPFGRGNYTSLPNGTLSFNCQHGEKECYGNKVHVCVITVLQKPLPDQLKFINCSMARTDLKNTDPLKYPIDECAAESGLNAQDIKNCAADPNVVDKTLKAYGDETIKHSIPSFPYIAFGSKFDNATSQQSEKDLLSVLCDQFIMKNETQYKDICKSQNSSATTLAFTAFPVILLTFVFSKLY